MEKVMRRIILYSLIACILAGGLIYSINKVFFNNWGQGVIDKFNNEDCAKYDDLEGYVTRQELVNSISLINIKTNQIQSSLSNYVTNDDFNIAINQINADIVTINSLLESCVTEEEYNLAISSLRGAQTTLSNLVDTRITNIQSSLSNYVTISDFQSAISQIESDIDLLDGLLDNCVTSVEFNLTVSSLQNAYDALVSVVNAIGGAGCIELYNKSSSDSSLNKGYTSGIKCNDVVSGFNFNAYNFIIVYFEVAGDQCSVVMDPSGSSIGSYSVWNLEGTNLSRVHFILGSSKTSFRVDFFDTSSSYAYNNSYFVYKIVGVNF